MRRVLILLCLAAAPLHAQKPTGDEGLAAPCREAAESDRPSRSQLLRCDRVIRQPGLAPG